MPLLELQINGVSRRVDVDPERSLLNVLRDELDLTGSKYGCGEGQCGACTVLVDHRPTRACLTKAASVAGRPIITIEGLERSASSIPFRRPLPRPTPCSAATAPPA
jgi:aerobic-type carbon monoxide dehydrogenase small subunit (CoxS/CutS family)